jgi:tetratricopeptide (TPR) repeat protein
MEERFFDPELDDWFFEADQLLKDNRIGSAVELLYRIVAREPAYGRAYNHLAWVYEVKYQNLEKAWELYRLAINYASDYLPVYLNAIVCLSKMERFEELKELLEQARQVPGISRSHLLGEEAIMYEMQQDYLKAIDTYKQAIAFTLSDDDIDYYKKCIERCQRKMNILNEYDR